MDEHTFSSFCPDQSADQGSRRQTPMTNGPPSLSPPVIMLVAFSASAAVHFPSSSDRIVSQSAKTSSVVPFALSIWRFHGVTLTEFRKTVRDSSKTAEGQRVSE